MTLRRRLLISSGVVMAIVLGVIVSAAWWMEVSSADALFIDPSTLPENKVGLVLGCSPFLKSGRKNLYYQNRIEAAVQLYREGKVSYLLVSRDNHAKAYDEASAMKHSLIEKGVQADRVVCDYAGFSTMESVIRAKEVFQLNRFTIITQRDHALRAVYIARHLGLDVVGYPAEDVGVQAGIKTKSREALARVRALLDLHVFRRQARFLGEPVHIGPNP